MDLTGKKALVTGSSRGIGKAIATALYNAGATVYINGAGNLQRCEDVCRGLGERAHALVCDLADVNCAQKLYSVTGDIDILVLNASVQYRNAWSQITTEEFETQINVNLRASLMLIQKYAPYMQNNKWGRIVTIGSVQEAKPHPDMLVYSASKAAQTNMVKSLSLQLAKDGVTVNNVAPGVIYTDRNVQALSDPEYAKKVIDSIPVGFYGEPEDCAGIVKLLCSEEGRYITGQNIFVDGGKSVQ